MVKKKTIIKRARDMNRQFIKKEIRCSKGDEKVLVLSHNQTKRILEHINRIFYISLAKLKSLRRVTGENAVSQTPSHVAGGRSQ